MFAGQYKNRRVLVTGHTGFKGAWLTSWLLELGAHVAGFSLPAVSTPSAFQVLDLEKRITHCFGDIRDPEKITAALQAFQPEVVFHMAAQALVRPSYEDPERTFSTNAMGTLHLLEAVRKTPSVKAVVCITSDKCYRNDEWVWGYRETDHLGGEDPYSASKACAEIIAHSYFRSFLQHIKKATVRAGNVIGGGDWAVDRIVPDCARAWALNQPATIRNPWATRPWQHVLEPLSGYLWLAACLLQEKEQVFPLDAEAFNFGPSADISATVADVAKKLSAYWPGFTVSMDKEKAMEKKECTLLKLCCDKALAHLKWQAALSLEETIQFTADWYKEFYQTSGAKESGYMYAVTIAQIHEYVKKAADQRIVWACSTEE